MQRTIDNYLPKRLKAAAALIPCCGTACDIGCDHGYLSIYLLQQKKVRKMIAMDVNSAPLARARNSAAQFGVTQQMEFRLSDGFAQMMPGEADFFICAGMGGKLILKIMSDHPQTTASMQGALLQPQSDVKLVRRFVYETGWHIEREDIVFEEDGGGKGLGKYYPMFLILPGREEMPPDEELAYGTLCRQLSPGVLRDFLQYQMRFRLQALYEARSSASARALERQRILEEELGEIESVLEKISAAEDSP